MDSPTLVWHYTNLATLATILDSGFLLATEVSFQNDILETSTADKAFAGALDELAHEERYRRFAATASETLQHFDSGALTGPRVESRLLADARFIFCASEDGDSLYAWRTYGALGISCAIGIDTAVPLGVLGPEYSFSRGHEWMPVIYSDRECRNLALTELRRLGDNWNKADRKGERQGFQSGGFDIVVRKVPEARALVRARAKNPSFKEEQERRVTMEPSDIYSVITLPSGMGPRPHLRLLRAQRWGATVQEGAARTQLPIRAVRLGPEAPQSAEQGLEWLLLTHGYPVGPQPVFDQDPATDSPDPVQISRSEHLYRTT